MHSPERSVVFQEVASAIGAESARQLIEAFGGTRIFVPRQIGLDHEIAKAIGRDAAERMASLFHGATLTLPISSRRRRRVLELQAQGKTRQEIARQSGYHERQVYRILGEEKDARQGDLFGQLGGEDLQPSLSGQ